MRVAQASVDDLGNGLYLRFVLQHLAGAVGGIPNHTDLPASGGLWQINPVRQLVQ
ncbi:hypothetical protein D3C75_562560 [compost metagenome]